MRGLGVGRDRYKMAVLLYMFPWRQCFSIRFHGDSASLGLPCPGIVADFSIWLWDKIWVRKA